MYHICTVVAAYDTRIVTARPILLKDIVDLLLELQKIVFTLFLKNLTQSNNLELKLILNSNKQIKSIMFENNISLPAISKEEFEKETIKLVYKFFNKELSLYQLGYNLQQLKNLS